MMFKSMRFPFVITTVIQRLFSMGIRVQLINNLLARWHE
jgi:hypothetical protein